MASDKNLYRDIRLGRIVNSNGRVIGSIVKKRENAPRERARREETEEEGEARENGMGSKMGETREEGGGELGCLHNFLS